MCLVDIIFPLMLHFFSLLFIILCLGGVDVSSLSMLPTVPSSRPLQVYQRGRLRPLLPSVPVSNTINTPNPIPPPSPNSPIPSSPVPSPPDSSEPAASHAVPTSVPAVDLTESSSPVALPRAARSTRNPHPVYNFVSMH